MDDVLLPHALFPLSRVRQNNRSASLGAIYDAQRITAPSKHISSSAVAYLCSMHSFVCLSVNWISRARIDFCDNFFDQAARWKLSLMSDFRWSVRSSNRHKSLPTSRKLLLLCSGTMLQCPAVGFTLRKCFKWNQIYFVKHTEVW